MGAKKFHDHTTGRNLMPAKHRSIARNQIRGGHSVRQKPVPTVSAPELPGKTTTLVSASLADPGLLHNDK